MKNDDRKLFHSRGNDGGFILISIMLLLSVFLTLYAAYALSSSLDTSTVRYSKDSTSGFYSAEAGLNVRADNIRTVFVGFNRPSGTSPTSTNPCIGGNQGSGDFICRNYAFNKRTVTSYIEEDPTNPLIITIPPGERYQNLSAQEYRYTAKSFSTNNLSEKEADLELRFKSRLVPLFQFAAFYNKDLEILPGPAMTLSGPVHTNGDLWLYSNSATLDISGQVTTAGDLWRGRKDGSVSPNCNNQQVRIMNPTTLTALVPTCPSRHKVTSTEIAPFNGMIQTKVQALTVPGPEVFDPSPGAVYWDHADLRLVLKESAGDVASGVEVRTAADTADSGATTQLLNAATCPGTVGGKAFGLTQIWNYRENKQIDLLDVDLTAVMNCLKVTNWFGTGKRLDDATDGGLVFHLTVKGPNSTVVNKYGVRIKNSAKIGSNIGGAPAVRGFTVVSDQAAYVQGSFNSTNKIPAAVMADSLNLLSNAWSDANSHSGIASRVASNTTFNSAFLAGTDTTGNIEGAGGINGAYNGGLENYPRLHENWSGKTMTYRGSFVSLGNARRVSGTWGSQSYNPPARDWNYDTSFNNAANLPPITPRFVYLRQELFVRDFEQ